MENIESKEILEYEDTFEKGVSKNQVQNFTQGDIEELYLVENSDDPGVEKKLNEDSIEKRPATEDKDPNDGGPRPPKEEEYPEKPGDEDDDLLSETSDPNHKE
jgi:hypothetical protein